MQVLTDIVDVRKAVATARAAGKRIGFVPTMGGLHAGHGACLRLAREHAEVLVASIFLNPIQFDAPADLEGYPADHDEDLTFCAAAGVDVVFAPTTTTLYPDGYATFTEVHGEMTQLLCGGARPGHFRGVCTVVLKLFNIVMPDVAVFGEKDLQQFAIIQRMTRDLDLPIELVACPTVRDADGLALSSRNRRLDPAARTIALSLPRGLERAHRAWRAGERTALKLCEAVYEAVLVHPGTEVDYADVIRLEDFSEVTQAAAGDVVFAAIFVDGVRLIDHVRLGEDPLPVSLDD